MQKIIKKLLLTILITALLTLVSVEVAVHLFESYYKAQWGISALILHAPPFGTHFTEKLTVVKTWATCIGVILGLISSVFISKWFLQNQRINK